MLPAVEAFLSAECLKVKRQNHVELNTIYSVFTLLLVASGLYILWLGMKGIEILEICCSDATIMW